VIAFTVVLVTIVESQPPNVATVKVKLDGETSGGEVPYVIPPTVTADT